MKLYFIKDIKKTNKNCKEYSGTKYYVDTGSVIQNEIVNSEEFDFCSKPSRANVCVNTGDVLFAKMQNSIKVIEVNESNKHYIFSTGFYCFSDKRIHPSYLRHYFLSKVFNGKKDKLCNGSTMKAINDDGMSKIFIDVPSIPEQQKCVVILNKLEKSIKKCEAEIEKMSEIVKSRFIEMFCSCKTKKPLEELTTKITDGSHNPPKGIEKSEFLMLSSQNVHNELDLTDVRYLTKEDFELENKRTDVQKGDVLLTIVGTIGRTHVVKENEKYTFQRSVGVIKPKNDILNGTFLSAYLHTEEAIDQLESGGHGSSQKGIYLKDIKKLLIPVPEYRMQLEFESFVELIDKSKFNYGGIACA